MVSPAYKACPTFVSSLHATCQLSRSCITLTSSNCFSVCFSLSMPSCLFPLRFFHSLPLFLLLTLSFAGFPIADEVILISKRQYPFEQIDTLFNIRYDILLLGQKLLTFHINFWLSTPHLSMCLPIRFPCLFIVLCVG